MANSVLAAQLDTLAEIHDTAGSTYKAAAYKKAATGVRAAPEITAENADDITVPGVGDKIRGKIIEFLNTGKIREIEANRAEMTARAELEKILGVGPATAGKWIKDGITTVAALRDAIGAGKIKLNNMQSLGLKYVDDLSRRIPRDEVTAIVGKISGIVTGIDPAAIVTCAGSYRRGAESSGDIDIIVTNRGTFVEDLIRRVIAAVEVAPEFIARVSEGDERYTFLWRCCDVGHSCVVRQVDILNIKYTQYYPALVYFTGSWEFNEAMRGFAKSKGYRLNQHGLFRGDVLVPTRSEEEVFDALGLVWVPPADRRGAADVIEK